MNALACVTIIFGIFIFLSRTPLIFAPEATREFYIRVFLATDKKLRITGVCTVAYAVLMIVVAQGHDQTPAVFIKYFAWFVAVVAALFEVILAPITREVAKNLLESWNLTTLRVLGFLGSQVGTVFICLGVAVG